MGTYLEAWSDLKTHAKVKIRKNNVSIFRMDSQRAANIDVLRHKY